MRISLFKGIAEFCSTLKIEFCSHLSLAPHSMRSFLAWSVPWYWYVISPWKRPEIHISFKLRDRDSCLFLFELPPYCSPSIHLLEANTRISRKWIENHWLGRWVVCPMQNLTQRSTLLILNLKKEYAPSNSLVFAKHKYVYLKTVCILKR